MKTAKEMLEMTEANTYSQVLILVNDILCRVECAATLGHTTVAIDRDIIGERAHLIDDAITELENIGYTVNYRRVGHGYYHVSWKEAK